MPTTFHVRINGGKKMVVETRSAFNFRMAVGAAFAHITDKELDRGKVKIEVMCPQYPEKGWYEYLLNFNDVGRLIINMATPKMRHR